MRRLDDLARLWNDTRAGMQRGAWAWPVATAVAGAMITLIGTSSFGTSSESESATASPAIESNTCEDQTWPYFSETCLQRNKTAEAPPAQAQKTNKVRVLNYDPAMAQAAIGATPWAPKDTSAFRQSHGRHKQAAPKQATRDADGSRGAATRSSRRDRGYDVPGDRDALSAYGYVPR